MVIVVGMHRSGTSALAGLLHKNNIAMGEEETFIPKPAEENVKGFYENYLFRRINDLIIERCGYRVKSWDRDVPKMSDTWFLRWRMRRILKRYEHKYDKWGWKDPRTCLTLGLWLKEITRVNLHSDCRVVFITRDPFAVANSMAKRKDTDHENALRLWLIYNEYVFDAIEKSDVLVHFLMYEDLCNNPVTTSRLLFKFLNHPLDESVILEFIDPSLNRSSAGSRSWQVSEELRIKLAAFEKKWRKESRRYERKGCYISS